MSFFVIRFCATVGLHLGYGLLPNLPQESSAVESTQNLRAQISLPRILFSIEFYIIILVIMPYSGSFEVVELFID